MKSEEGLPIVTRIQRILSDKDLVKVCRYPEDSLGGKSVEGDDLFNSEDGEDDEGGDVGGGEEAIPGR